MSTATEKSTGRLLLASASPRRKELLGRLGLEFEIKPVDLDESRRRGEAGADYVQRLAADKARAAIEMGATGTVIASDTAVEVDGDVLGKPADEADALRMLAQLSGRTHEVLTAVAVHDTARETLALNRSSVTFRTLSREEMVDYWHSGEPCDKAGAYAIQGLGAVFVAELHGSYSGVMGLPLFETANLLREFGYRIPGHAKRNTD
jgi:septum formation protein